MTSTLANRVQQCDGFDWDEGNQTKNLIKHGVSTHEAEEAFWVKPPLLAEDRNHSQLEQRYLCLGKTSAGRLLFISFTIRNNKIRVISARNQDRRERRAYEQAA